MDSQPTIYKRENPLASCIVAANIYKERQDFSTASVIIELENSSNQFGHQYCVIPYETFKGIELNVTSMTSILGSPVDITTASVNIKSNNRYNNNIDILNFSLTKELLKNKHYINVAFSKAELSLKKIIDEIALLNFKNAIVELLPYDLVKIKVKIDLEKMLIITKSLQNMDDDDVLFSFFKNSELILSNTISLSTLIDGFNSYMSEEV